MSAADGTNPVIPPVSAIADILVLWGMHGWLTPPLRPVVPALVPVLGVVSTISIIAAPFGPGLGRVYETLSTDLTGRFVVVGGAGAIAGAVWGEIMSTAASSHGATGVLIDGSVRDQRNMAATGLPIYAADQRVVGPNGTAHAIEIDATVTIGGVSISNGDYVVADETGCVRIPHAALDEVLEAAGRYVAAEDRVLESLHAGEPLTVAYLHKKAVVDALRR